MGVKRLLTDLYHLNASFLKDRRYIRQSLINDSDERYNEIEKKVLGNTETIFVLSTGRCGTELLTRILSLGEKVDVHHSPDPELVIPSKLAYYNINKKESLQTGILHARFDLIEKSYIKKFKYIETNCRITFFAYQLEKLFDKVKFIHLIRDPYSFAQSAISRGYYQSYKADRGHIKDKNKEKWSSMNLTEKVTWNWLETNNFIEGFKTQSKSEILTVTSQDLFKSKKSIDEIVDFIGIESINLARAYSYQNIKFNKSSRNKEKKVQSDRIKDMVINAKPYSYFK